MEGPLARVQKIVAAVGVLGLLERMAARVDKVEQAVPA